MKTWAHLSHYNPSTQSIRLNVNRSTISPQHLQKIHRTLQKLPKNITFVHCFLTESEPLWVQKLGFKKVATLKDHLTQNEHVQDLILWEKKR
jgi:hypothetical protein